MRPRPGTAHSARHPLLGGQGAGRVLLATHSEPHRTWQGPVSFGRTRGERCGGPATETGRDGGGSISAHTERFPNNTSWPPRRTGCFPPGRGSNGSCLGGPRQHSHGAPQALRTPHPSGVREQGGCPVSAHKRGQVPHPCPAWSNHRLPGPPGHGKLLATPSRAWDAWPQDTVLPTSVQRGRRAPHPPAHCPVSRPDLSFWG